VIVWGAADFCRQVVEGFGTVFVNFAIVSVGGCIGRRQETDRSITTGTLTGRTRYCEQVGVHQHEL
jgi:hypothetical protein